MGIGAEHAVACYAWEGAGGAEIRLAPGEFVFRSTEACGCGQLRLEGLAPDTEYSGVFCCPLGEVPVAFRTLVQPAGECLLRLGVIADPHLSCKKENRKGRFFVESPDILAATLRQAKADGCEFLLLPGDITNEGTSEEYDLASQILRQCGIPFFAIPGNHDKHPELWQKSFGARSWIHELPGGPIVGIDNANGVLTDESAELLAKALYRYGRVTVLSHYQLFPAPWICHGGKASETFAIQNAVQHQELLAELQQSGSVIWCGHQNIVARTQIGGACQINFPQPTQYPCAWGLVERFSSGMRYEQRPIESEALRQISRRTGIDAAAFYHEPQWEPDYRDGKDLYQLNFFQSEP
ncbi:MAG: metallophosphoesterase [Victivallales bacterium]|nr:metallophosphoesterase [Victivallales bacterium]